MSDVRVLVTGASGFLGRSVVGALQGPGWDVHATARSVAAADSRATWHAADLLQETAARDLVHAVRPTHLLHLAWCVEPGTFWHDPANVRWVEATLRLTREFAAAGGKRVVAVGTCAEYEATAAPCHETKTPVRPGTLYGVCKAATSTVLSAWAPQADVSLVWARLFHLFGPHEPRGRLVSDVADALADGRPIALSEGRQVRDYLHIEDAAAALVHLLAADVSGPVNVGSGVATEVRWLVAEMGRIAGRPELLRFGERDTPAGEPPSIVADIGRLTATGWRPRRDLRAALEETLLIRQAS